MLRSINGIIGYTFFAKENDVGKCKDLCTTIMNGSFQGTIPLECHS